MVEIVGGQGIQQASTQQAGFAGISVCGDYRPGRAPRPGDRQWCFQAVKPA